MVSSEQPEMDGTCGARGGIKAWLPWYVKIPAKIVLSRLPISRRAWQKANLFRAGTADVPAYQFGVLTSHLAGCGLQAVEGKIVLEVGPGNSLLTALFARTLGAAHTWLVDAEDLAEYDLCSFAAAADFLAAKGLKPPAISIDDDLSRQLSYTYLTGGLNSLRSVPTASIDFLFSQAVMEHIRLAEFDELVRETRRVLKPDGAASHWIDFRDHLQYALNNLRFSERVWESDFMARSGFYTNRIPLTSMKKRFQKAGFSVRVATEHLWPSGLPTKQAKMAPLFRAMPPNELMAMHAHVVLHPS